MTAKEYAKAKAQAGGRWFSSKYAWVFAIGGLGAIIVRSMYDHLPAGIDIAGIVAFVTGIAGKFSELNQKHSAPAIADLVIKGLKSDIDRGDQEHAECMHLHHEHGNEIIKLRQDVNEISGEAVKQGWKLGLGS